MCGNFVPPPNNSHFYTRLLSCVLYSHDIDGHLYMFRCVSCPHIRSRICVPVKCEKYSVKCEILRRKLVIYRSFYQITFICGIFVTIPIGHVYYRLQCSRLSPFIGVHMVHVGPIKCEKYSLKSEILGENLRIPTFYARLLSFVLYFCQYRLTRMYMLQCSEEFQIFRKVQIFISSNFHKKFKFSEKVHIFRKRTNWRNFKRVKKVL